LKAASFLLAAFLHSNQNNLSYEKPHAFQLDRNHCAEKKNNASYQGIADATVAKQNIGH